VIYSVVLFALMTTTTCLLRSKLFVTFKNINIMYIGVLGFVALEAIAKILIGLFMGASAAALVGYLITFLISGGCAYYFFNKTKP